jgi:glycosyltransferase involved in cell wall biosynthesis
MISVIFPYWQRKEATDDNIALMSTLYAGMDVEVVVVDDGSPEPYETQAGIARVVRLPAKREPKNPSTPINRGVAAARGDYLVLTSPEISHRAPLLGAMRDELDKQGRDAYIQAAVWCADEGRWHSHSSVAGQGDTYLPAGACLHFLAMLHRDLWTKAGGFDEDYRDGAAFEDNDFVMRLHRAGAKFISRDDLVADHPHKEPRTKWLPGQWERNKAVFESKWPC